MKILLASPFYSPHWDAGHFWARAFSRLGHELVLWDYRTDPTPPEGTSCDLAVVMKGDSRTLVPTTIAPTRVCYWPDSFDRGPDDGDGQPAVNFPDAEELLSHYDVVFTSMRPTPEGMIWLPGAWDERVHVRGDAIVFTDALFVGTRTDRKVAFLKELRPHRVMGNGWKHTTEVVTHMGSSGHMGPRYLHDYVGELSRYLLLINIHRDDIGLNRRLFEMMACGFTITDLVPGVREILGEFLIARVAFETPAEGRELKDYYIELSKTNPEIIQMLWQQEKAAIASYTYTHLAQSIIDHVNALS